MSTTEEKAIAAAMEASAAVARAIAAYEEAEFGSHVTQPLRDALANIQFSIDEVKS